MAYQPPSCDNGEYPAAGEYTLRNTAAMLTAAAQNPMPCPRDPQTCGCPQHGADPHQRAVRLSLVTGPNLADDPNAYPVKTCTGRYSCECAECEKRKRHLQAVGAKPVPQPWDVRPARHLRAA
jgi:hypothetical protein